MHLAEESDPIDPVLYIETEPLSKEKMMEEINETLSLITNSQIHDIVRYLLNKHHKEYFSAPAAKRLHHAYAGGLAYHTISMLRLAKIIVDQYESVDPSLLYGGLILHDLGKVKELSGPISTDYTLEGNLVGHIVIIAEEIGKACQALEIDEQEEDVLLLKHMVLSHHGQLEFGSPVRPRLLEAEILSAIDDLDASIFMIEDAVSRTEPGNYTERIFGLENRSFYVPSEIVSGDTEED
jgi:3'-5' exoribonuclease